MGHMLTNYKKYAGHPIDVFFETGTYLGESLGRVIEMGCFKEYHSVELSSELFSQASQRYRDNMAVFLYCGNSPDILRMRLDEQMCAKSTLFWLDAHYQGIDPDHQLDGKYGECPLLQEMEVIKACRWLTPPVLVIDDARMFIDEYWVTGNNFRMFRREHWPTMEQIRQSMPDYRFVVEDDQVIGYSR